MRTKIVQKNGLYQLLHESTGAILAERATREECQTFANELRGIVKAEAAKTKIAELGADEESDIITLSFVGGETTSDLRVFAEDIEALSSTPFLDSNGNEIPRAFREGFVLRPGTFHASNGRAVTFTRADILEVAANHNPAYPPKIQLQHRGCPKETQGFVPLMNVTGTTEEDTRLHVVLEFRGKDAVDKVEAGLYRDLSGGFYRTPGRQRMKECSVVDEGAVGGTGGEPARILGLGAGGQPVEKLNNGGEGVAASIPAKKGESIMSFWHKMFGGMVKSARAEKAAKNEAVTLSAGVTEADLAAIEAGDTEALTREKALAVAESLGFDIEGTKKALAAMELDGALPAEQKDALASASVDLAAVPAPVLTLLKAQGDQIESLQARLDQQATDARTARDKRAVMDLMAAGKITPADEAPTLELLSALDETRAATFLRLKGLSDSEIQFGRLSAPDVSKTPTGTRAPEEAVKEAMANLAAIGMTFDADGKPIDANLSRATL